MATGCPCGLPQPYAECCGPLHDGQSSAPTAERLMRSRYSAFAVRDDAYLLQTWHPRTRPRRLVFDPSQRWTGLEVLGTTGGGLFDVEGTVEFRAHYTDRQGAQALHEHSRFARDGGRWVYVGPTG